MKEFQDVLSKLVALPGKALDSVSAAIATPNSAIKYTILVVVLHDLYSGGVLVSGLLGMASANIAALVLFQFGSGPINIGGQNRDLVVVLFELASDRQPQHTGTPHD